MYKKGGGKLKNYLREARVSLKGHYLNAICASMIYYIVAYAIFSIVKAIPVAPVYKYFIGVALVAFIMFPVTAGYIDYFKNRKNYSFPSPKVLFRFHSGYSAMLLCVLAVGLGLVFAFLFFYVVTILIMVAVPGAIRFYILCAAVFVYALLVVYVLIRFWPLLYLVLEKGRQPFGYYIKECLKLTKHKTKEYIKFLLRFWRLFLICILPLGLGLLVFFPILVTAKVNYFYDLTEKK